MSGYYTTYRVLSLMAGSSADGVTAALIRYGQSPSTDWTYELLAGEEWPYPPSLQEKLQRPLSAQTPEDLLHLSIIYTDWTAASVRRFIAPYACDLIAWHPHNVFHEPRAGLTWSLGDSERFRVLAGLPIVTHFRARDIATEGTGAPLIPNADQLLFSTYETLINLGGIANLTHLPSGTAYDITPCNQLLNALARQVDPSLPYDDDGQIAAQGRELPDLAEKIESLPFFDLPPPKALDNLTVQQDFILPFLSYPASPADKLHTAIQVIVRQLARALTTVGAKTYTLTGGGAFNTFLVKLVAERVAPQGIAFIPAPQTLILYREAIGFGLLGLLRWLGLPNTYKRWTGSSRSHSSGTLSL
ncbi:MAG: anhydro-N-acetylmuramic acid kinase [Bacteroidia bacterium]|nr:anhydro-N-acetylmuramic acid kinase [Bacteroidia bacterium]